MFNKLCTEKPKKVILLNGNTRIKEKIAFFPDTICTLVSIDVTDIKNVNIKGLCTQKSCGKV